MNNHLTRATWLSFGLLGILALSVRILHYPFLVKLDESQVEELSVRVVSRLRQDDRQLVVSLQSQTQIGNCLSFKDGGLPSASKRAPKGKVKLSTVANTDGLKFKFAEINGANSKYNIGAEFFDRSGAEQLVRGVITYVLGSEKPTGVFMDVGMNLGYYTTLAAKYGYFVHAFELQPYCFQFAMAGAQANGLMDKIIPHNAPLSNKKISIKQRDGQCKSGTYDVSKPETFRGKKGFSFADLDSLRLDAVMDECKIQDVALLKMDIDGAEVGALLGFVQSLEKGKVHTMILEIGGLTEGAIVGNSEEEARDIYPKVFKSFKFIYSESEASKWSKGQLKYCPSTLATWEEMLNKGNIVCRRDVPLPCL